MTPVTAIVIGLTGGIGVGFTSYREVLDQILGHVGRRRRRERDAYEARIANLADQNCIHIAERNKWKTRFRMAQNAAVVENTRLVEDIRALERKVPLVLPRAIDAKEQIHRELAPDCMDSIDVEPPCEDLSMFHVRQAG